MKLRNLFKTFFLLLFSFSLFAAEGTKKEEWDVYRDDRGYYLGLKKEEFKLIKIESFGIKPKIMKVIPYKKNDKVVFIHYFAGETGTTSAVKQFHVVIFNSEDKSFIGKAPFKYASANPGLDQPVWTFEKENITVVDPYQGKMVFPLP